MSTIRCRVASRLISFSYPFFLLVLLLGPLSAGAANPTGLSISPPNPTIYIGESVQLTVTGSYDDGTQQVIRQARQVSAGNYHTCAVAVDGTVQCWGRNFSGQLGNGTTTNSFTPVLVNGISNAISVSAGDEHTCATLADGTVQCWGQNYSGQLGNGTTTASLIPIAVNGIANAVSVSAGGGHSCAALADGTMWCWGSNGLGQLGNGTTTRSSVPVPVSGISSAVSVSAGSSHTCSTLVDGRVACWGENNSGQIGLPNSYRYLTTPSGVFLGTGKKAVTVGAGLNHTCASLTDGTVKCWGSNVSGQLGNGTAIDSSNPVTVSNMSNAVSVDVGNYYSCAMLADGTVRCWGSNFAGVLGDGTIASSLTPVSVSDITNAIAVSVGSQHTCAVLNDRTVQCWGYNSFGQLGNKAAPASTPVAVSGIGNAISASAGLTSTCTALADGTLRCWGYNNEGKLGNGTTALSLTPISVSDISNAMSIKTNVTHTCIVLADGTLRCWGSNGVGQLGNGTWSYDPVTTPVPVSGIANAVSVSLGFEYACAVLADGRVQCWGDSPYYFSYVPITISGINNAVSVATGNHPFFSHNCVLLADGMVQCWGYNNFGNLGNGTTDSSSAPVTVLGINNAVSVDAGVSHTCVALADGSVQCWGTNSNGQLGNGTTTNSSSPMAVRGISNAISVSAGGDYGGDHSCALLADGTVQCWGSNGAGQLGNGTTTDSPIPVPVSGINNAVSVSAGGSHTCATLADGTLWCWGNNFWGQLGNGAASGFSTIPVPNVGFNALIYNSSDPAVASVNGTGRVTGISTGSALISAMLDGSSASATVTVEANAADLDIVMIDTPDPALQGQTVTYDIIVTNNGPNPATGVTTNGTLPACTLGNLAPGASATCTWTVTASSIGTLTQSVSVSGNETDLNLANNTTTASTTVNPAADLALSMTDSPDPVKKGAKLTYTLTVTNNGPSSASNVTLSDMLPANIVFEKVTTTQGSCNGTTSVTCALGPLSSGASATVTITIKPKATGTLTNRATVSATEGDIDTGNNSASATTRVSRWGYLSKAAQVVLLVLTNANGFR